MRRTKPKNKLMRVNSPTAGHRPSKGPPERELAPVVWVGWQIRPGEKYFGVVQRADGTVERTRLERDNLQAAADFVTAHQKGHAASIRGRQVQRYSESCRAKRRRLVPYRKEKQKHEEVPHAQHKKSVQQFFGERHSEG
jgi:hypothetical protein